MDPLTDHDSPLSVTSSVAGILTFLVAILAAAYVRVSYLRNSDEEYLKVKTSLSWYKTESAWLAELLAAAEGGGRPGAPRRLETEYQMYAFVMDDLLRLEKRLLELVAETELRAAAEEATTTTGGGGGGAGGGSSLEKGAGKAGSIAERWVGVVTGSSAGAPWWRVTTGVAVAWLPVRAKALELVRQRDALTARVLFTQMSMVSSRIRDLEHHTRFLEAKTDDNLRRLEDAMVEQRGEIGRLQDLVQRRLTTAHRGKRDSGAAAAAASWTTGPVVESPLHSPVELDSPLGGLLKSRRGSLLYSRASAQQGNTTDSGATVTNDGGGGMGARPDSRRSQTRTLSTPYSRRPRSR